MVHCEQVAVSLCMSQHTPLSPRNNFMSAAPVEQNGVQWGDPFHGSGPPQYHALSNVKTVPMTTANPHCPSEEPAGSQTLPHYIKFFDFNGTIVTTMDHTLPLSSMPSESVNDEYPYDPRLFDVDTQFGPPLLGTNHSHVDFHVPIPWNHFTAMGATPDGATKVVSPVSQLGPMPTTPGISNFEPMMVTYGGTRLPPTPKSPSQSSSITRSSSSNGMMTFSRKNSHNYAQLSPASGVAEPTQLNARFEAMPTPGSSTRNKTITIQRPIEPTKGKRRKSSAEGEKSKRRTNTTRPVEVRRVPSEKHDPLPKNSVFINLHHDRADSTHILSSPSSPGRIGDKLTTANFTSEPKSVKPTGFQQDVTHSTALQRQRNRAAATKCRAKSKVAVAELEAMERAMSTEHMELSATVMDLREEVLTLKNQLLLHGNCNCEHIQQYLTNAARNIGVTSVARQGSTHDSRDKS